MFRMLFWFLVYVFFLCLVSIRIKYRDGLTIKMIGILEWIAGEDND